MTSPTRLFSDYSITKDEVLTQQLTSDDEWDGLLLSEEEDEVEQESLSPAENNLNEALITCLVEQLHFDESHVVSVMTETNKRFDTLLDFLVESRHRHYKLKVTSSEVTTRCGFDSCCNADQWATDAEVMMIYSRFAARGSFFREGVLDAIVFDRCRSVDDAWGVLRTSREQTVGLWLPEGFSAVYFVYQRWSWKDCRTDLEAMPTISEIFRMGRKWLLSRMRCHADKFPRNTNLTELCTVKLRELFVDLVVGDMWCPSQTF
jgi:hypothetical protein